MKEIMIVLDHPENEGLLVGMLKGLFPECELRVLYKRSPAGRSVFPSSACSFSEERKELRD